VADPLGGSFYLEHLTSKLERLAMDEVRNIEKMGGMLRSIENGYVKREILRSAYKKQLEIEAGQRVIVGVNKYTTKRASRYKAQSVSATIQRIRVAQLRKLRRRRDDSEVKGSLERIRSVALSSRNLMPAIAKAVRSKCTVGEMSDVLREVFGEYKPSAPL